MVQQCWERAYENGPPVPWEDADPNTTSLWLEAIEQLAEFLVREVDTTFTELSSKLGEILAGKAWDQLSEQDRYSYQIIVRHVVNLVTAEDADDLKDAIEYDWWRTNVVFKE